MIAILIFRCHLGLRFLDGLLERELFWRLCMGLNTGGHSSFLSMFIGHQRFLELFLRQRVVRGIESRASKTVGMFCCQSGGISSLIIKQ